MSLSLYPAFLNLHMKKASLNFLLYVWKNCKFNQYSISFGKKRTQKTIFGVSFAFHGIWSENEKSSLSSKFPLQNFQLSNWFCLTSENFVWELFGWRKRFGLRKDSDCWEVASFPCDSVWDDKIWFLGEISLSWGSSWI